MPPYMLTPTEDLTTLVHKIIVSLVTSAHVLIYNQIRVHQVVGTTLLKPSILSGLFPSLLGVGVLLMTFAFSYIHSDQ